MAEPPRDTSTDTGGVLNAQKHTRERQPQTARRDSRSARERFMQKQGLPHVLDERFQSEASPRNRLRNYTTTVAKEMKLNAARTGRNVRHHTPVPVRRALARANWWLIGFSVMWWYWVFIFGITAAIFFGLSAIGDTEITGDVTLREAVDIYSRVTSIFPALNPIGFFAKLLGIDFGQLFSPLTIGLIFYILSSCLSFLWFFGAGLWFVRANENNPFTSTSGIILTGFCLAGSMAPIAQLFPWIIVWTALIGSGALSSIVSR